MGDLYPFIAVGLELKSRGHQPVIAAWKSYHSVIQTSGLEFVPLSPDVAALMNPESCRQIMDPSLGGIWSLDHLVFPYLRQNFEELRDAAAATDLVVSHNGSFIGGIVAEKFNRKWLSVYLQPMPLYSRFDPPVMPAMPLKRFGHRRRWALALTLGLLKCQTREFIEPIQKFREELGLERSTRNPLFESYSPFGNLGWFSRVFGTSRPDWPRRTEVTGFPVYDGPVADGMPRH